MTIADYAALVACLAVPFMLLYGLGRLSRWYVGRRDQIDLLIVTPHWCKDGDAYMNTMDQKKAERAGERRWQQTLRAQRRTRKPAKAETPPARNVIQMKGTRRSA